MAARDERQQDPENGSEEEDAEIEDENWDDWEEDSGSLGLLCLFCNTVYDSSSSLFEHCASAHFFDFHGIKKACNLDFYQCLKLMNYVRSQVAVNRCWSCGVEFMSNKALLEHLHGPVQFEGSSFPWNDDKYLTPFLHDDPLLYSFNADEEDEDADADAMSTDGKEMKSYLSEFENIEICDENGDDDACASESRMLCENRGKGVVLTSERDEKSPKSFQSPSNGDMNDENHAIVSARTFAKEINITNRNYFGSYSSFGIHREMISDKVRTDTYQQAVSKNPSLTRGAVIMDVGCGTGILSLFAAKAGASRVIAVEASHKMAAVASQIARDNNLLFSVKKGNDDGLQSGVIQVVESMVEELHNAVAIEPKSVDVLISEWMGYCLLYESMLTSVLFARDTWLKPGGAILPDTATMFVAGFGRGATSIPFWENVYGFGMSCIGREIVDDAARFPVVDVVDKGDVITTTEVLQAFDLVTMQPKQMDFTAEVELIPNLAAAASSTNNHKPEVIWCYGVVIWFETGFTERFCREKPVTLSTSPYETSTHWAQTLLTFKEPVAMATGPGSLSENITTANAPPVGTHDSPAAKLRSRISIVRGRASQHRSLDISLEITCVGIDDRIHHRPPQMFCLN